MNWNFLLGPLVGGIIGYITNGIAIKMLFRPLKPIYIGGRKLPFTPGLIPKEKSRIAKSIGEVISKELINEEILSKALLKKEIYDFIEKKIDEFLITQEMNEETLESLTSRMVGHERLTYFMCEAEETVTYKIYNKLVEMDLGQVVVDKLMTSLKEGGMSTLLGPMAFFVNDSMIESLGGKIAPIISKMVAEEGEELIRKAVEEERAKFQNESIGTVVSKIRPYDELIKRITFTSYEYMVRKKLKGVLEMINISVLVEERINAYDTLEMEKIILSLMSKELNAIVWLGALLGAIMGCIMSIF